LGASAIAMPKATPFRRRSGSRTIGHSSAAKSGVIWPSSRLADHGQEAERRHRHPADIRAHAATFDTSVFRSRMRDLLVRHGADPSLLADG
jgi:hypothetical protein